MIYQELLYSRSFSKDYRWMIIPSDVSSESLKALNQLYNLYDKYKNAFSKSPLSPLYCLNHPGVTFLVSCGLSNHKDRDGRDIYCLQGICVPHEYRRHFWFILPWILANYNSENLLNAWGKIDFHSADDIVRRASEDCFFKLDQLDESLAKITQPSKSTPENLPINEPVYISFDENGLKEISHLLSSYHDCLDFAFGATPEMVKSFNFKIIAEAGSRSKIETDMRMITADVTPSFAAYDKEQTISESLNDPVDRFDPRKKGDLNQLKTSRRNGSSHILRQFLPRFLSVFKIGKKLKRFRNSSRQE